jgi:hypothetical protein
MQSLFLIGVMLFSAATTSTANTAFKASTKSQASVSAQAYMLCKSYSQNRNEDCMVVDHTGKRLTPELFNSPDEQPYDGIIRTIKRVPDEHKGDWYFGYINIHGKAIAPANWAERDDKNASTSPYPLGFFSKRQLNRFSDGLAKICDSSCGYLAPDGSWAIAARSDWTEARDFHHGLALVRGPGYVSDPGPISSIGPQHIKQPWSVIDKSGRIVMGYDPSLEKNHNLSKEQRKLGFGYGLYTLPMIDIISDFIDGRAVFRPGIPSHLAHNMGPGMVDTAGRIVVQPSAKLDGESRLRETYFPQENRKPGAALDKKFCIREDFYEGLAYAFKSCWTDKHGSHTSAETGFINRQGEWVIKPQKYLTLQTPFRDGHAIVKIYEPDLMSDTHALMDRRGRIVASYRLLLGVN